MKEENERAQIYIALLNEATDVWRAVEALRLKDDIYQITATNSDADIEEWEFKNGDIVRCKERIFSDGTKANVVYESVRAR